MTKLTKKQLKKRKAAFAGSGQSEQKSKKCWVKTKYKNKYRSC